MEYYESGIKVIVVVSKIAIPDEPKSIMRGTKKQSPKKLMISNLMCDTYLTESPSLFFHVPLAFANFADSYLGIISA